MGLFWNASNKTANEVVKIMNEINLLWEIVVQNIERDEGVTAANVNAVTAASVMIQEKQKTFNSLIGNLSESKKRSLYVTWIDGESVNINSWLGICAMLSMQLCYFFDEYEKNKRYNY